MHCVYRGRQILCQGTGVPFIMEKNDEVRVCHLQSAGSAVICRDFDLAYGEAGAGCILNGTGGGAGDAFYFLTRGG